MRKPAFFRAAMAKLLCAVLMGAALSGCSAIKLAYNNLPELGYWWLDGYFDFGDDQAQWVREDIARLHAWHRTNELGRYVVLLQRMERMAPGDTTAEQQPSGYRGEDPHR